MTILHVTEVSSGGVLPVIAGLCNGLATKYRIIFAYGVRFDTPTDIEELFDDSIVLIRLYKLKRELNVNKDIEAMLELKKIVKEYRPDVIHFHSSKAGFVGRVALWKDHRFKIYSPHGYSFLKPDYNEVKKRIFLYAEKILAQSKCITLACGQDEYTIAKKITKYAACIENGLDVSYVDKCTKEYATKGEFSIYSIGRIGPQKNPRMFNELAQKYPDIPFYWIGGGGNADELTSNNITITGVVNREEALKCAMSCECYVSCSPSEGLPISLLEAMYMGKTCIVSNVSGNKELLDADTGFLFDNIEQCCEVINQIRLDLSISNEKKKKAKEKVLKYYTMDKMCDRYDRLISQMMNDK